MKFDSVYTVKIEHSQEDFLRSALLRMAQELEAPVDVLKTEFEEVRISSKEVILCTAHVESDYTASIGYDRQEEYYEKVKKYDADTQQYYYENELRIRTVTDWSPFSGHIGGDATTARLNGTGYYDNDRLVLLLQRVRKDSITDRGEAEVSEYAVEAAEQDCKEIVMSRVAFPGDRVKDIRSSGTAEVSTLTCFKLPYYETSYTYQGKKYTVCGFACGGMDIQVECPKNEIPVTELAAKDTQKLRRGAVIGWIVFGAVFVLAGALFAAHFYWTWLPLMCLYGGAVVLHIISDKKYTQRVKTLTESALQSKRDELESTLKTRGYTGLSSTEKEVFNATAGERYANDYKRKTFVKPTVICAVLLAVLMLVSVICQASYAAKLLHSPEQFTVTVTNIKSRSANVNEYYVDLTYRVKADRIGAEYMSVKTTVFNKTGTKIGEVTSRFSTMNLDAGAEKTYQTYLLSYSLSSDTNQLFARLYQGQYKDFTFKSEITDITFSDGKTYSAHLNTYY